MLQTRAIFGTDLPDLFETLNNELTKIDSEKVEIKYFLDNLTIVIEFEESYNRLCCECQHWDSSNGTSDVNGFCQLSGNRKRFNCRACKNYKDIRA